MANQRHLINIHRFSLTDEEPMAVKSLLAAFLTHFSSEDHMLHTLEGQTLPLDTIRGD